MPRTASRSRTHTSQFVGVPELPPGFVPLPEALIAAQTDSGSFQRGKTYFRGGRIFGRVRRGPTLTAGCFGSSGGPYRVAATLAMVDPATGAPGANPVAVACDCPRGGFCKHIVALLLTWNDDPAGFAERPAVADLLAGRTRDDLVALVEAMLLVAPDLEVLIELPLPSAESLPETPADEAAVRRQIDEALGPVLDGGGGFGAGGFGGGGFGYGEYGYGWHGLDSPGYDEAKLTRLVALGNAYAEAGRWRDALVVFAPLIEAVTADTEAFYTEDDGFAPVLVAATAGLVAALDAQTSLPAGERLAPADRERLIGVLFALWEADAEDDGDDGANTASAAIARNATADERQEIERRLRTLIEPAKERFSPQHGLNRVAIGFLGLLAGEGGLSPEQLLAEYRTAELWEDAAAMLLELDRVDEAIVLAARHLPGATELTQFADHLMAAGDARRVEQGLDLVESRLWEREGQHAHDDALSLQWLEQRYADHGRPDKALEAARRRFKAAPTKETFDAVRTAALRLGGADDRWPTLRTDLIAALRKRSLWATTVDIHLDEGAVADALAAFKKTQRAGAAYGSRAIAFGCDGWSGNDQETRLAAAAERDFPDEAITIYRGLADRFIAQRQRPSYQEAAKHLARVKAVLLAAGREPEWTESIATIRQQHKTLRALREELDALSLG